MTCDALRESVPCWCFMWSILEANRRGFEAFNGLWMAFEFRVREKENGNSPYSNSYVLIRTIKCKSFNRKLLLKSLVFIFQWTQFVYLWYSFFNELSLSNSLHQLGSGLGVLGWQGYAADLVSRLHFLSWGLIQVKINLCIISLPYIFYLDFTWTKGHFCQLCGFCHSRISTFIGKV